MATKKSSPAKAVAEPKPRQLKRPRRGKRVKKHLRVTRDPLPKARHVLVGALKHLFKHWRVFLGITFIYLVLTIMLVKGFGSGTNVGQLKQVLIGAVHGNVAAISGGLTILGVLIGSVGSATSDVAGAYQTILLVVTSLALIWALRQTHSDDHPRITIRDAFYKGMYPLVPIVLVLIVMGLQVIPIALANVLYNIVFVGKLASTWYEQYICAALLFGLVISSLYMLSSSAFALYIVTLPDVKPFQALRSARELVRYRRWAILRKVVFLPIIILISVGVIILPLIYLWAASVAWIFLFLTMFALAVMHSYMYSLYRSLL